MLSSRLGYNLRSQTYLNWSKFTVLSVLMTGVFGMSPLAGDEPLPGDKTEKKQPSEQVVPADQTVKPAVKTPSTTLKDVETYLEFPLDVTEMFEVNFAPKLKKLSSYKDESRFVYSVPVTLENITSDDIPGPIRLIILGTGEKGLRIISEDGLISKTNEEYTEFYASGKLIKKTAKSKPRTLVFASKTELKPEEFTTEKMVWRISREDGETLPEILKKKNGKLGDDDKLLAEKEYSRAELRQAMNVQEQFTENMFSENYAHKDKMVREIFGTGITEDKSGQPAMIIFVARLGLEDIFPKKIDGMNVVVKVTEPFRSGPAGAGKKAAPGKIALSPLPDDLVSPLANPRSRFTRPVPIGSSIANVSQDCYSGTLGFRGTIVGTTSKVIVTNNHVIGELNGAVLGEKINQPSTGDVIPACTRPVADEIGQFRLFIPIIFSSTANNLVDTAMADTTTLLVNSSTPTDDGGYGFPATTPIDAVVGMRVMKYGRTTAFTKGPIISINSIVTINDVQGPARFINQIVVGPDGGASLGQGGDSGSLIVSESQKQPVALLFAGGGGETIGNPIKEVLRLLNVTIDGAPIEPPPPPTAKGSIGDFVFNDANDDGIQTTGETGISGVSVRLLQAGTDNVINTDDDVLVKSTNTASDGKYIFENLVDGIYYVRFILPDGRKFAKQNIGADSLDSDANITTGFTDPITIVAENEVTNVDCGMLIDSTQFIGRIGNYVWLDVNRNGKQEFTERGLAGVTVELIDSTEEVIKTTTTNRRGFYVFEQLGAGTYAVRFKIGAGLKFSPSHEGSDYRDSDANVETGRTEFFRLDKGRLDFTRDCGVYKTN